MSNDTHHLSTKAKRWLTIFYVFCGIVFALDFVVHRHGHFHWEEWPGFYATFGFVAFAFLVLGSRYILRPLIKREEDFYD